MRDLRHVVLMLLVGLWPAMAAAGIDEGDVRRSLAQQGFEVDHVQMRPGADIVVQAHRKGRPVTLVFDAQRGVLLSHHEGAKPTALAADGVRQRQHASRGTLGSAQDDDDHRPGKGRTPPRTADDVSDSPEDANPDPADDLDDLDDGWDHVDDPDDDSPGEGDDSWDDGDGTWDDDDVGDTPGDEADEAFGDDEAEDGDDMAEDDDAGGWDDTEGGVEADEDGGDATDDDA